VFLIKEHQTPDWQKLEQVIADIQSVLAPGAVVQHDEPVIGKSGARRKLDVSIRQNIGADSMLIVIDCKHHKDNTTRVNRKDVAGFAEQLQDVRANLGIMVSTSGYSSGAQDVAHNNSIKIILKTYREAEQTDWENLVGCGRWFNFNQIQYKLETVRMILEGGKKVAGVPTNLILYNRDGSFYGQADGKPISFSEFFIDVWGKSPRPRQIGPDVYLEFDQIEPPLFVPVSERVLARIDVLILEGTVIPKRYGANVAMDTGRVLSEINAEEAEHIKASIEFVNLVDLVNTQEGIEYTKEEWERHEQQEERLPLLPFTKDDQIRIDMAGVRKDLLTK